MTRLPKVLIAPLALALAACFDADDPEPAGLDGRYETVVFQDSADIPGGMPRTDGWKDAIHLRGDSVQFLQCRYYSSPGPAAPETLKVFTLSTGRFRISGDTLHQEFSTYSRKEYANPGWVDFDTIPFEPSENDYRVSSRIRVRPDGLDIEYSGDSSRHFVRFQRTDAWSL